MPNSYVTLFDSNYIPVGFAMLESLFQRDSTANLYLICMDSNVYFRAKSAFPKAILINIDDVERFYQELDVAKSNRSPVEYFYTLSSVSVNYVFENYEIDSFLTYVDSDLFFFSSPDPIYDELQEKAASVGIISHRFNFFSRRCLKYGKYNVGWVSFKSDSIGRMCAKDWMLCCLDWCYQRVEINRYADQKYLDYWPHKFKKVHEIAHLGANVAVWNMTQFAIEKDADGKVLYKGMPLIFYHFAGLKNLGNAIFDTNLSASFVFTTKFIRDSLYVPYLICLLAYSNGSRIVPKDDVHVRGIQHHLRRFIKAVKKCIFRDIVRIANV